MRASRLFFAIAVTLAAVAIAPARASTTVNVTNQGATAYLFDGAGPNQTLNLVRGQSYVFQVSAMGHPFHIASAPGIPVSDFVDAGLIGNGTASGTVQFTVPMVSATPLAYQCGVHTAMTGTINLLAPAAAVPAVGPFGAASLAVLALAAGLVLLRRRTRAS
jgi:hypothetical protein